MNLAAAPASREHVKDIDGVHILSLIAEYNDRDLRETVDESEQRIFQVLKAVSHASSGIAHANRCLTESTENCARLPCRI